MSDDVNHHGPRADAFVFFGATGDLAYEMIFPALLALVKSGRLDCPIIGVAGRPLDKAAFEQTARKSVEAHKSGGVDEAAFEKLCALLHYVSGDYRKKKTFDDIRAALGSAAHPLHYLAIPPDLFADVCAGLAASGSARGARVVLEKPFGRNERSARQLNSTLRRTFAERDIFRVDHFLGKEAVQNLRYFRFANPMVGPLWDRHHVESVQITMAESFGIKTRGALYETTGAIRDVVQNHLLQVLACVAMEEPVAGAPDGVRDATAKLLQSVRPLRKGDVVRGQYDGYRNEPKVAPGSNIETYAAARFAIINPRWADVPFFLRAGKCLAADCTEVVVTLKSTARAGGAEQPHTNAFRFRISPSLDVGLRVAVKRPGAAAVGDDTELVLTDIEPTARSPYERILDDAMAGDQSLFAREDAVLAEWRIVDAILDDEAPVPHYARGTWGPRDATSVYPDALKPLTSSR